MTVYATLAKTNPIGAPNHVTQLWSNFGEVTQLLNLHTFVGGSGPGRRSGVEILNKSALVLTVACWEAYVEDLSNAALNHMIQHSADHTAFPKAVLERVASKHQGPRAWALAGNGWRKALKENYQEIVAKTSGTLNTPRAEQVDDLFSKSIGLEKMSKNWKWPGRSNRAALDALDKLITTRGSIAHRVQHARSVRKKEVLDAIQLISFLAAKSTNAVNSHLDSCTKNKPWKLITFKGVS